MKDVITGLPNRIITGIKGIFIPDMEEMKTEFNSFVDQVQPATYAGGDSDAEMLGGLLHVNSSEPMDITSDIKIGSISFSGIKFLDLSYFKQGVVYFRPVINAVLTWLLGMFYYNQLLVFLGQAPIMAKSHNDFKAHQAE